SGRLAAGRRLGGVGRTGRGGGSSRPAAGSARSPGRLLGPDRRGCLPRGPRAGIGGGLDLAGGPARVRGLGIDARTRPRAGDGRRARSPAALGPAVRGRGRCLRPGGGPEPRSGVLPAGARSAVAGGGRGPALAPRATVVLGSPPHPSSDREPSGSIPTGGPGDRPSREHRAKYPVVPWKSLALRGSS